MSSRKFTGESRWRCRGKFITIALFHIHVSTCSRWRWLPARWIPWHDSRTWLECYNDGKLVNHGSITLKLKHYSNGSFQDHQFFIVETPACREIIIGHPASIRLGLIKVLCQNIAQPVTAKAAKPSKLTKITNINGKAPCRWPSSRSEHNSSSGGWKGCKFDSFQVPHFKTLISKRA